MKEAGIAGLLCFALVYILVGIGTAAGRPHWGDLGNLFYVCVFPAHALLFVVGRFALKNAIRFCQWLITRPPHA